MALKMKIENSDHVHGALRAKGYSCRAWAIEHGFNPRTVLHCINYFAPNTGKKPKRMLAKEIVSALSKTIEFDLTGDSNE